MKMKRVKVVTVNSESLVFDNGVVLTSNHETDCCEDHYLSFADLTLADFDGLEFDLTSDTFFERIEDFGITLNPLVGHPVSIPGYGSNNGYYSSNLDLVLINNDGDVYKSFNVSECQRIN